MERQASTANPKKENIKTDGDIFFVIFLKPISHEIYEKKYAAIV
jgi:hypothetical protein